MLKRAMIHQVRVRPCQRHWHAEQHVWDAISSARLPGRPMGRNLVFTVSGYPIPQAAVTRDHGCETFRTIVDLRPLNCEVVVLDVPEVVRLSVSLVPDCTPLALGAALCEGRLACQCNDRPFSAGLRLPPDTDVLAFLPALPSAAVFPAHVWQTSWEDVAHPAVNMQERPVAFSQGPSPD